MLQIASVVKNPDLGTQLNSLAVRRDLVYMIDDTMRTSYVVRFTNAVHRHLGALLLFFSVMIIRRFYEADITRWVGISRTTIEKHQQLVEWPHPCAATRHHRPQIDHRNRHTIEVQKKSLKLRFSGKMLSLRKHHQIRSFAWDQIGYSSRFYNVFFLLKFILPVFFRFGLAVFFVSFQSRTTL